MMRTDSFELAKTMKSYENVPRMALMEGVPVIIRVDGRAFKNFTKGLAAPFDEVFRTAMRNTMIALCANVGNCVLGYTFSDEISLVLIQKTPSTDPWFKNEVEKMVSNSASLATLFFNREFVAAASKAIEKDPALKKRYEPKFWRATFDSRVFNLPEKEITNYLLWRQMDCMRNSIASAVRALPGITHATTHGQDLTAMKMMLSGGGTPWESFSSYNRYGVFAVKRPMTFTRVVNNDTVEFTRDKWTFLEETPNLKENRNAVSEFMAAG